MKKKPKQGKKIYITICPKCKSPDISIDKSNPLQPGFGLPSQYICNYCNNTGFNFPEVEVSKFKEFENKAGKISEKKKDPAAPVDIRYGDFAVWVLWKIISPITLIAGIIILKRDLLPGIILIVVGLFLFYIAYIRKWRIKD